MSRIDQYLMIPEDYGRWLGGLRWSDGGEAVEHVAEDPEVGLTFVMAGEIAEFLAGFRASRSLIPFAYVLHWMNLLGVGARGPMSGRRKLFRRAERLATAFRKAGRPMRNAGVFCGALCRDIPREVDPPDDDDLNDRLARGPIGFRPESVPETAEIPSLEPEEFEARALTALEEVSDEALSHWLSHGRGPVEDAAGPIADEVLAARPRSLAETIAEVESRPQWARMAPLVAHLAGALTLPARRLSGESIPVGGYADLATRGLPEQILPFQFALDDLEFLRRFAGRELLYFHREQPQASADEELILLLDQGVRTWGDVRLVISAAALALARMAARKGLALRLGSTSSPVASASEMDEAEIAAMLDASDLSPHPGLALETVLERPSSGLRDIVLLTHPRNLAEAEVSAAARRVAPGTRLFATTIDGSGGVGLWEVRHGGPVALGRCKVTIPGPWEPPAEVSVVPKTAQGWRGDVEPIGFPFRLGVVKRIDRGHYAFDYAGKWIFATCPPLGLVYAWRVDGSEMEILPRAMIDGGRPLSEITAVVGVAGGVVVVGRSGADFVLAHYDFATRRCVVLRKVGGAEAVSGVDSLEFDWYYMRSFHSVAVRSVDQGDVLFAVDLEEEGRSASDHDERSHGDTKRAKLAMSQSSPQPPGRLPLASVNKPWPSTGTCLLWLDHGAFSLWIGGRFVGKTTPLHDGRPALEGGGKVGEVRRAGGVLAIAIETRGVGSELHVYGTTRSGRSPSLLDRPEGQGVEPPVLDLPNLGVYPLKKDESRFVLSPDGHRFAHAVSAFVLEVRDLAGGARPLLTTSRARVHDKFDGVNLGISCLWVRAGNHMHLLQWDRDVLSWTYGHKVATAIQGLAFPKSLEVDASYDPARFGVSQTVGGLTIFVDCLGHVAMLDGRLELIAMFHFFRKQMAAWLPDGTKFGPASLIGGPSSPQAAEKIGEALRAASRRGGAES